MDGVKVTPNQGVLEELARGINLSLHAAAREFDNKGKKKESRNKSASMEDKTETMLSTANCNIW